MVKVFSLEINLKFLKANNMIKISSILFITVLFISCMDNKVVLPRSVGAYNKVTVVTKGSLWTGSIGDEIRSSFG